MPWFYKKLSQESVDKNRIVKFNYVCFIVVILGALILGSIAPFLMKIFLGKAFYSSYIYVIWIALGASFQIMYSIMSYYILYSNKTYLLAIVTIITTIVNVIMNYTFISKFGSIGAAQACTITYFLQFIFVCIVASKVYPMPWKKTLLSILHC